MVISDITAAVTQYWSEMQLEGVYLYTYKQQTTIQADYAYFKAKPNNKLSRSMIRQLMLKAKHRTASTWMFSSVIDYSLYLIWQCQSMWQKMV